MRRFCGSIFSRILAASIAPFALAFALALALVIGAVNSYHRARVVDIANAFSENAAAKVTDALRHISSSLDLTARIMALAASDDDHGRETVLEALHALMDANPSEINCAWYVFKPGAISGKTPWDARSFLRRNGGIVEIPAVEELDDPEISPWHVFPFRSGKPYVDVIDYWDYGVGGDREYTGTVAYPVIRDGEIIGTVGMDILYEKIFHAAADWRIPGAWLLISETGHVIGSSERGFSGRLSDLGFAPGDLDAIGSAFRNGTPLSKAMPSPLSGRQSLVNMAPLPLNDGQHRLTLLLDFPTEELDRAVADVTDKMTALFLYGLAAAGVTVFLVMRSVVRPIKRITECSEAMAAGDSAKVHELLDISGGGTETRVMVESFRKMLAEMEENQRLKLSAKEAEIEMEKMREMARVRTHFFANMSHELRTPMNAIIGFSDVLISEDMPERQLKWVRDIKTSSESLLVIVDDILDISKLETGALKLVESDFNLSSLLDNIASMISYLAAKKNLAFSMDKGADVPEYLVGDEVRLRQILVNVLGNAVKYTREGSVRLAARVDGEDLFFDVSDTGIGIRDEDRGKLFTAFHQFDAVRNREIKGTGLGLSISMSLARMMGGDITIDSVYGSGSAFHIRVPCRRGAGGAAVPAPSTRDREGEIAFAARVLVVDDSKVNLRVAHDLMTLFGLSCETAASGPEALELARENRYDLVFMDHKMPGMDGVETVRRLRELGGRWSELPIVALTANTLAGADGKMLDAGANDCLAKPIRKAELRKILIKWLSNSTDTTVRNRGGEGEINSAARVLVVDDSEMNLRVAHDLMALFGLSCETAASGPEALELARENRYDLVFMDHKMPGMDGVETVRRLRELGGRWSELPIVALTADALAGVDRKMLDAGMNGFLAKPIRKAELRKILAKWLPPPAAGKEDRQAGAGEKEAGDGPARDALATLRGIPGLNVDMGLKTINGSAELYFDLMRLLREELDANMATLRSIHSDAKLLEIKIHAMKSNFASVGAEELSDLAAALERRLSEGDAAYCQDHLPRFLTKVDAFRDALAEAPLA